MYTADRKKRNALETLSLCSSAEDSLLECPRANIQRLSSTFNFVSKPRSGKDLQFILFSVFTTVLITNNGRLDQRVWFKNDILEDFFDSGLHTLRWVTTDTQRHRELKTPPAPLHLWEGQRVWYTQFGALQLACTPDLSKRPRNKSKSRQGNFALFAFTIKIRSKDDIASYIYIISYGMIHDAAVLRRVNIATQFVRYLSVEYSHTVWSVYWYDTYCRSYRIIFLYFRSYTTRKRRQQDTPFVYTSST